MSLIGSTSFGFVQNTIQDFSEHRIELLVAWPQKLCASLTDRASGKWKLSPFPNKPWFLRVCSTSLLKTLWEKEKLLVTSSFSFSRSVFFQFQKVCDIFIEFEITVCKLFQFGTV